MKNSRLREKIFHFLPFWIFGIAFLVKIILLLAEFSLTFAKNKKLLYDFQDSWMGRDELPGEIFLLSFILSFIWMFLIFFLRRKKELTDRWCCAIGFFLFPIIMCFIIDLLPHRPNKFRREFNSRVGCTANMEELGYVLAMYAHDNNDFYPDNLEMISSYFGGDRESFYCPEAKQKEGSSDYIYFGKGKKVTDPPFVLLEDKTENHRGNFKNRLMSDNVVIPSKKIE